jgi:diaminohydroxyphosphoribosylaminopyrimidine deaminase/5-amino-6-(5-phosphoribosylamino)uracil reductase
VVARIDPNPKVSGQGIERLRAAGIRVDVGLMTEEAGRIIESFACHITTGLPLVVSKVGMSLDGKIGTAAKIDRCISSPEAMEFGQKLRLRADALLVGAGTVLADDPELTYRGIKPKTRPLIRVILDSDLQISANARLFQTAEQFPVLICCTRDAATAGGAKLERKGVEILPIPAQGDQLDLRAILKELGRRDILSVLVEGGSLVHWSFLSNRLIDKFYFLIASVILGGKNAVPAVGGSGYDVIAEAPRFKLGRSFSAGPDMVLETYPAYSRSIISPWLSSENAPSDGRDPAPSSRRK